MENYWFIASPVKYLKFLTWDKLKLHKNMMQTISKSRMTESSNWLLTQSQLRASLVRQGPASGLRSYGFRRIVSGYFWPSPCLSVPISALHYDSRPSPFFSFDSVFLFIDLGIIFSHFISGQLKHSSFISSTSILFCD